MIIMDSKIQIVKEVQFGKQLRYYVSIYTSNIDHIDHLLTKFRNDELFPKAKEEVEKGQ